MRSMGPPRRAGDTKFPPIPRVRKNRAAECGCPSDSRAPTAPREAETEPLTAGSLTDDVGRKPSVCSALSPRPRSSKSTRAGKVQRAQLSGPLSGDGPPPLTGEGLLEKVPEIKYAVVFPAQVPPVGGSAVLSTALIWSQRGLRGQGNRGGQARATACTAGTHGKQVSGQTQEEAL